MPKMKKDKNYFEFDIGSFGVFFNKKYHLVSTVNDLMLGIWFVAGSVFFLFHSTMMAGTILFILGSLQLLARPILKLLHGFFIRKETEQEMKEDTPSEIIEELTDQDER